jgi:coproporphyrinogen III oxidase-like Fe-S oxidoreductase
MKAIHDNSKEAHHVHASTGKGLVWQMKIMGLLRRNGIAMTTRQIKETLRADDFNLIRPEVTRLIQAGLLKEAGRIICPKSGHRVMTVSITERL